MFKKYSNEVNTSKYSGSNSTVTGPAIDGKCRFFDKSWQNLTNLVKPWQNLKKIDKNWQKGWRQMLHTVNFCQDLSKFVNICQKLGFKHSILLRRIIWFFIKVLIFIGIYYIRIKSQKLEETCNKCEIVYG